MDQGAELVGEDPTGFSLKHRIVLTLSSQREDPPLKVGGYLRVSSLPGLCPREEVLATVLGVVRIDKIEPWTQLIFEHGHALHHQLQNSILAPLPVFVGQWRCTWCGFLEGGRPLPDLAPVNVPRPSSCPSGCRPPGDSSDESTFEYVEQFFQDLDLGIGGHPDGFLVAPGVLTEGILEAKSIGHHRIHLVKYAPDISHVVQLQLYMYLTGLTWGKILYWDKGGSGLSSLIEHHVERDEDTIEAVKTMVREIRAGLESGKLPDRICAASDCERAMGCALVKPCFTLTDHVVAP